MEVNTTMAAAVIKKSALSSSLFSSMVIFQDPAYIFIASLGAFVSMASAYYDYTQADSEKSLGKQMGKAFMIGAIFTLLSFMVLTHTNVYILEYFEIPYLVDILPSFWLVLTLALSTESVKIWDQVKKTVKGKL